MEGILPSFDVQSLALQFVDRRRQRSDSPHYWGVNLGYTGQKIGELHSAYWMLAHNEGRGSFVLGSEGLHQISSKSD